MSDTTQEKMLRLPELHELFEEFMNVWQLPRTSVVLPSQDELPTTHVWWSHGCLQGDVIVLAYNECDDEPDWEDPMLPLWVGTVPRQSEEPEEPTYEAQLQLAEYYAANLSMQAFGVKRALVILETLKGAPAAYGSTTLRALNIDEGLVPTQSSGYHP